MNHSIAVRRIMLSSIFGDSVKHGLQVVGELAMIARISLVEVCCLQCFRRADGYNPATLGRRVLALQRFGELLA